MSFSKVLGQPRAIRSLRVLLSARRIPDAMLFTGPGGIGKALAAREFAKALNCEAGGQDACDSCASCRQIEKGIHPDVREADPAFQAALRDEEPEKQMHVRIETIRELLLEAQRKAIYSPWKVFIIHEAETMQPAAASALLKLLEEPPQNTLWILLSLKKDAMLATILSRCQWVEFSPLPEDVIRDILVAQSFTDDEAAVLAKLSGGGVDRAKEAASLIEKLAPLDSGSPTYPFDVSKSLGKELAPAREQASLMIDLLAENARLMWTQATGIAEKEKIASAVMKLSNYKKYIRQNVSPHLVIETALLELEQLKINVITQIIN